MKDSLGDRIKAYEQTFTKTKLDPYNNYIYARLDGRNFSKLTRGLDRPFDYDFIECMIAVMNNLASEFNADIAYCQSDEISLGWKKIGPDSEFIFSAKIQKLASLMAARASTSMMREIVELTKSGVPKWITVYNNFSPCFDCRVFEVPDAVDLYNAFEWRYQDCKRNWVSQWARTYLSHKETQNKSRKELVELMESKDFFPDSIPYKCRYGTLLYKEYLPSIFSTESDRRPYVVMKEHFSDDDSGYRAKKKVFDKLFDTKLLENHKTKVLT